MADKEWLNLYEIDKTILLLASQDHSFVLQTSTGEIRFRLQRERQWVYEMIMEPETWRQRVVDECGAMHDPEEVMQIFAELHAESDRFPSEDFWPWKGFGIKADDRIYECVKMPLRSIVIQQTRNGMPFLLSHKFDENWGIVYYQEIPQAIEGMLHAIGEADISDTRVKYFRKLFLNQNGYPDNPEWYAKKFGPLYRLSFTENYALNQQERAIISSMNPKPDSDVSSFNGARFGYTLLISAIVIFIPIVCVAGALLLPYLITQMGRPAGRRR